MNTREVGKKLVDYCRAGKNMEAIDKLYDKKIVSVEATDAGGPIPRKLEGIDKVREKNDWWIKNNEVHDASVEGPFPHDEKFAVKYHYDVTPKDGPMKGQRMKMDEVAIYTVKDGKIVREEFYYDM